MRDVEKSTAAFEAWQATQTDVAAKLIERKHRKMSEGAFPFLRATFYRWVEQWPACCPALAARTDDVLLAVGDLHVENFGTWLDSREQLVWGVNDFDEAGELPFTSDLVRLAASALLGAEEAQLVTPTEELPALFLEGYRSGLEANGRPVLLEGAAATGEYPFALPPGEPEGPAKFWTKKLDPEDSPIIPASDLHPEVAELFRASLPPGATPVFRKERKPGGLGSLGRRRFTAVLETEDEMIGREVKALVPSAVSWLAGRAGALSKTASLLQRAIRDPDPQFLINDRWLLRQFGPDAIKIDLSDLPKDGRQRMEPDLFRAMGWETANIHLGSRGRRLLLAALRGLEREVGADWLDRATDAMAASTRDDFEEWKAAHPPE